MRSYLGFFVTILIGSSLAIAIVEMLLKFDEIVERSPGLAGAARYMTVRIPSYYFRDLLPIVSFGASFCAVATAARARETAALRAGGLSLRRTLVPLLAAATLLSLAALLAGETVVLQTTRTARLWENPGEPDLPGRGSSWLRRGDRIYSIRDADPDGRLLRGVDLYDLSPEGRLLRSLRADVVRVEDDGRWHFTDATTHAFEPGDPTAPARTRRGVERWLPPPAEEDLTSSPLDATTLGLSELLTAGGPPDALGGNERRMQSELHARLADPAAVLVFALLAIPFGLSIERGRGAATAALGGIACVSLYHAIRSLGDAIAAGELLPVAAPPWLALAGFAAIGVWRFARIPC
jgi:lipopolysaccharide export LptBFGC system permease protein LptF